MVTVQAVAPDSPAERAGIAVGDILISINGKDINDVLDYRFYLTERRISLLLHRGCELIRVEIEKPRYDDIGLDFQSFLMDDQRRCKNKCVFCFIDQLPKGMRSTLYFKDDDSRMSFLAGSYVTLTNMSDEDIERILRMHISPIHISIHTTNPALRVRMMGNPRADRVMEIMRRFADGGIEMHGQIVLCRGWNDGAELERTMRDLETLYPAMQSVSVVPIGLTKHRQRLTPMEPYDRESAEAVLDQIEAFAAQSRRKRGSAMIFASDEWYLKAERDIPDEEAYEGYPQLDNGVGLLRSLKSEWQDAIEDETLSGEGVGDYAIATGYAASGMMNELVEELNRRFPGSHGVVYPIRNDFFGHEITVAGLVTGQDLAAQLKGKPLGRRLLLPYVMLRHERDRFLDDMTPDELKTILGTEIVFTECDGYDLINTILTPSGQDEGKDG